MVRVIALHVFRQFGCATLALAFGVTIKRGASAAAIRTNFDAKRYGNSTGAVGRIQRQGYAMLLDRPFLVWSAKATRTGAVRLNSAVLLKHVMFD